MFASGRPVVSFLLEEGDHFDIIKPEEFRKKLCPEI